MANGRRLPFATCWRGSDTKPIWRGGSALLKSVPIQFHDCFEMPEEQATLWRYSDLAKLVSLLQNKSLWFANAEILARDDPFEAFLPLDNFSHRSWQHLSDIPTALLDQFIRLGYVDDRASQADNLQRIQVETDKILSGVLLERRNFFVSCWHRARHESVAMWKMYGAVNGGVAIKSSTARIKKAFEAITFPMFIGNVRYINGIEDKIETSINLFTPTTVKRSPFSYEKETRIVCWNQFPIKSTKGISFSSAALTETLFKHVDGSPIPEGIAVDCDVAALLEAIVISPFAPPWYVDVISKVAQSLGVAVEVYQSDLLDPPRE